MLSLSNEKMLVALVLAAPFALFVALLVTRPADAGAFAGEVVTGITDPPILIGILAAGVAGGMNWGWYWALVIGIVVGAAGCLLGYFWWQKVAGSTIAIDTAARYMAWSVGFVFYGFIAGRLFVRPHQAKSPRPEANL